MTLSRFHPSKESHLKIISLDLVHLIWKCKSIYDIILILTYVHTRNYLSTTEPLLLFNPRLYITFSYGTKQLGIRWVLITEYELFFLCITTTTTYNCFNFCPRIKPSKLGPIKINSGGGDKSGIQQNCMKVTGGRLRLKITFHCHMLNITNLPSGLVINLIPR
jgi:hypothetical protein